MATFDEPVVASTSWHCKRSNGIRSAIRWARDDGNSQSEKDNLSTTVTIIVHPEKDDSLIPCSITFVSYYGIKDITITSDSKNIEFYLDKMIYQSTVRGSKLDICAENGSINGLYKVAQSFPEPYPFFCTIKCLSLPNKKELHLHDVFITLAASTTSSCSSSKEAVSKPKIDMQQVQGIINSIGGPKADKVGQLLSTVQGNQKNSGTSNLAQLFLSQLPLLRQEIAKPTTSTIEHQTGKNDVDLAKNDTKPTVDGKENSLLPMDKTVGSDANKEKADLSLIREYVDNAIERTSENIIKEINDKIESNNKAIVSRLDQITKQLELITSGKNVTENLEENGK